MTRNGADSKDLYMQADRLHLLWLSAQLKRAFLSHSYHVSTYTIQVLIKQDVCLTELFIYITDSFKERDELPEESFLKSFSLSPEVNYLLIYVYIILLQKKNILNIIAVSPQNLIEK